MLPGVRARGYWWRGGAGGATAGACFLCARDTLPLLHVMLLAFALRCCACVLAYLWCNTPTQAPPLCRPMHRCPLRMRPLLAGPCGINIVGRSSKQACQTNSAVGLRLPRAPVDGLLYLALLKRYHIHVHTATLQRQTELSVQPKSPCVAQVRSRACVALHPLVSLAQYMTIFAAYGLHSAKIFLQTRVVKFGCS
jgi:hypothetical protein